MNHVDVPLADPDDEEDFARLVIDRFFRVWAHGDTIYFDRQVTVAKKDGSTLEVDRVTSVVDPHRVVRRIQMEVSR